MAIVTLIRDPNTPTFDAVDETFKVKAVKVFAVSPGLGFTVPYYVITYNQMVLAGVSMLTLHRPPAVFYVGWYRVREVC